MIRMRVCIRSRFSSHGVHAYKQRYCRAQIRQEIAMKVLRTIIPLGTAFLMFVMFRDVLQMVILSLLVTTQ
jgi:hypothetical protein